MVTGYQQPDPRAGRPGRESNRCMQPSRPRALSENGRGRNDVIEYHGNSQWDAVVRGASGPLRRDTALHSKVRPTNTPALRASVRHPGATRQAQMRASFGPPQGCDGSGHLDHELADVSVSFGPRGGLRTRCWRTVACRGMARAGHLRRVPLPPRPALRAVIPESHHFTHLRSQVVGYAGTCASHRAGPGLPCLPAVDRETGGTREPLEPLPGQAMRRHRSVRRDRMRDVVAKPCGDRIGPDR